MKGATLIVAIIAASGLSTGSAFSLKQSPVPQIVSLLGELKTKIESDGQSEQASYDKFACWCEDTLSRKASDISTGKEKVEELGTLIVKLKSEIGALTTDIAQLKKDIAANLESQEEARNVRAKEHQEYQEEKSEAEQCIGALEAAIKVLAGAGTGSGRSFLGTIQEAQVLGVVAGVKGVLKRQSVSSRLSDKDLAIVQNFVDHPDEVLGSHSGVLSAAQIAQNPFGDYAPQSNQIQGILKGMYESFTTDLERSNADESQKQQAFLQLMATKQREAATLQATLETNTLDKAQKSQLLADSKSELDDTKTQLAADEQFFAETKTGCKTKATEWSQRTRMRTEELNGIAQAIRILQSGLETFENATSTFIQLAKVKKHMTSHPRAAAFEKLSQVASKTHNVGMAQIAAAVKTGGHFDEIITMINKMIEVLRAEEADDISHRDRCERMTNKNSNDKEDLEHSVSKAEGAIERMNNTQTELNNQINELDSAIMASKGSIADLQNMRASEESQFRTALKDDADAVDLLEQAIVALTNFYKKNNIDIEMLQKKKKQEIVAAAPGAASPEYTVDPDVAPETSWQGGNYGGRKGESQGIIAILSMIKEDLQNEMKVARTEDAEAQSQYLSELKTLSETMQAQKASKLALEKQLSELQGKMLDEEEYKNQKGADLGDQETLSQTLATDCSWVQTHFDSRREKRQTEMQGLVDAKNYLAGAEDDDDFE